MANKRNREYWKKRSERNFEQAERLINDQTEDLTIAFEDAQRQVQSKINEFYFKYSINNKVSYADAQKMLSFDELKNFKGDLEEFRRKSTDSIGTFNLEVENLSMQARVTRLQALNTNIDAVLNNLYQTSSKLTKKTASQEYVEQYYRQLFDIDQYHGMHFNFATIDPSTVRKAVEMPINGASYSERIWRQNQDLSYKLRTTIMETVITGKNPAELTKKFAKDFEVKKYEAYRLLNTEVATVHADATAQAYLEDGIEYYEVLATLDSKTSQICREMDGKVFEVAKVEKGINYPPFHPNCRTTTVAHFPEFEEIPYIRIARDEDGKNYEVPGDMTYEKWKKQFVPINGSYRGIDKSTGKSFEIDDDLIEIFNQVEEESGKLFPNPMAYIDSIREAKLGEIFSFEMTPVYENNQYYLREYFNVGIKAKNLNLLDKEINKMVNTGHSYKGFCVKSMVYHEYTHEKIMQYVVEDLGMEFNSPISEKQWDRIRGKYLQLNAEISQKSIKSFYSNYEEGYNEVIKELGYYAREDFQELISQAVSKVATVGTENKAIQEIYDRVVNLK